LPATSGRAVGGSGSAGLLEGGQVNGSGTVNGGVIQGAPTGGSGTVNGGVIQSAPVGGSGTVNGGFATGGVVTGEVVNGGSVGIPYNGSPASGLVTQPRVVAQPTFSQPTNAIYDGGIGIGGAIDSGYGGYIDSGSCYSGVVGAPVSYIEPSPVFATAAPSVSQVLSGGGGRAANWVVGFSALSFSRDYEDGVRLGENAQGQRLFSDDADDGQFGGCSCNVAIFDLPWSRTFGT